MTPPVDPDTLTVGDVVSLNGSKQTATLTVTSLTPLEANVKDYGAVGDKIADDTAAVRAAAATGLTVYFPPGDYLVSPDVGQPVLSVPSAGLSIRGDGVGVSNIWWKFAGLQDPSAHWAVVAGKVARGSFLKCLTGCGPVVLRGLRIDGGYTVGSGSGADANTTTGKGWDKSHKCVWLDGPYPMESLEVDDCDITNWAGERLYAGGTYLQQADVTNTTLRGGDGSVISMSTQLTVTGGKIGGSGTDKVYNAFECQSMNPNQGVTLNGVNVEGATNGLVWIGYGGSKLRVNGGSVRNCSRGVMLTDAAHDAVIDGVRFTGCPNDVMITKTSTTGFPKGFSDVTVQNCTTDGGILINNQVGDCLGFKVRANTIPAGALLGGVWNNPSTGFEVSDNTVLAPARDCQSYSGTAAAVWSGTRRSFPWTNSGGVKLDNFGHAAALTISPFTDLIWLNDDGGVPCRVTLATTGRTWPIGFTARVSSSKSHWTLALPAGDVPVPNSDPLGVWVVWDGTRWALGSEPPEPPVYDGCPLGAVLDNGYIADTANGGKFGQGIYFHNYSPTDDGKELCTFSPDHDLPTGGGILGGIVDSVGQVPSNPTYLIPAGTVHSGTRTLVDVETGWIPFRSPGGPWRLYAHGEVIGGKVPGLSTPNQYQETHFWESPVPLGPYTAMGPAIPNAKGPPFSDSTHTGYEQVFPPFFFGPKQAEWLAHSLRRDANYPPLTAWSESDDGTNFALPQTFAQDTDRYPVCYPPRVADSYWCRGAWFKSGGTWYCVGRGHWRDGAVTRTRVAVFEVGLDESDRPLRPTGRYWKLVDGTGDYPTLDYVQEVSGCVRGSTLHLFILWGFFKAGGRERLQWLTAPIN